MAEEKTTGVSRRNFLKYAGVVAGGAAIGGAAIAGVTACGTKETTTTIAKTVPGPTKTVEVEQFKCPYGDGPVFGTAAALKSHFETAHPNKPVWGGHLFGYYK